MHQAESWLFRSGLALVVLAPLPLGANRPWAWTLLAVTAGVLAVAQAVLILAGRARTPARLGPLAPAVALWLGVVGWAVVQAQLFSLDPHAGGQALLRWGTAAAVFWLCLTWGGSRRRRVAALRAVAVAAVGYAVLGLALLSLGDRLPFGEKTAHLGSATGPFPNRNTFALWLGMGLCALAAASVQAGAWRSVARVWPWIAGGAAVGVALLLTQSRAGVAAVAVGLAVTALRLGARGLAVVLPVVLAALALALPLGERLASLAAAPLPRLTAWGTVVEGIARDAWTGVGLGAFADAFAALRPRELLQPWRYAHNGYLELAWELGVPAAVALVVALAWVVWRAARVGGTTGAAALGAATAWALHALADFSPQIPAVTLLLAALLGVACGRGSPPEAAAPARPPARPASAADPRPTPAPPAAARPPAPPDRPRPRHGRPGADG